MTTDIRRTIVKAKESDIPKVLRESRPGNIGRPRGRRPVEIGYTGLEVFGNVITGDIVEYNREWQGKLRYKNADKMRKGDATCAATLLAIVLPIVSTDIVVETRSPGEERPDPIVEEAADFIYWNLFDSMEKGWQTWVREACLYLAYGHYAFEKIFKEIKTGPYSGMVGWRDFAPRHPSTFEYWYFDDHGHFKGVEQQAFSTDKNAYVTANIPIEKMIWLTNQEEAGNPLGVSVLRPAFKHWKYKDGYYAVQAIAIERQGAGVPYGRYPAGSKPEDIDALEEMLQNIQAHEQSYVTYEEGWEAGFLDMGSAKILDPADAIEHQDQMIPKSILAGFLNLTQGDRGSFALSSDSSGFFTYSLQHTANTIASVVNEQAVRELCDFNFPNLPVYPKVRFNKVGHISLEHIIDGIDKLGSQGFLTPTLELENHIRNLLNLPALDEYELEEIKKEEEKVAMDLAKAQGKDPGEPEEEVPEKEPPERGDRPG